MEGSHVRNKKLLLEWGGFGCVLVLTILLYMVATGDYSSLSMAITDCSHGQSGCNSPDQIGHTTPSQLPTTPAPQSCREDVRERHLANVCDNWRTVRHIRFQDPGTYWALLVDDVHKVLYCIMPKAGCTSIQTMIINSTGQLKGRDEMEVHDPKILSKLKFKYLHEYPFEEIIWRLEHYFKFMVVRHPFERLYSAYKDKIRTVPYFKSRFGKIIKKYFPSHDPKNNTKPLELSEFLELVGKEYDTGYKDRHWATYDEICHPCDIKYDYIAKLETLHDDLPKLLPRFPNKNGTVPTGIPSLHVKQSQSRYEDKFRDVPGDIMRRVYSLYQMDFQLFGYSWKNNTAGNCAVQDGDNVCC